MELRNLITFYKITKVKSFIKAAKELGYAQSTITTQIQLLEQELGVKLFERVGKNMNLTSNGLAFLEYAEKIINLTEEAKKAVSNTNIPEGTLKIGVVESLCTIKLPKILKNYHLKYPEVEIIIKVGTCQDLYNMLKNNTIDLALVLGEPIEDSDLNSYMSSKEDMLLLASPLNRLANKKNLSIRDIAKEPLILTENGCSYRNVFISMFYKENIQPKLSLEIGSIETIKTFVMSNLGITFLPAMSVNNELQGKKLVKLDLIDYKFNIRTQLLYHKNKWISAAMKAFISDLSPKQ
ncbi:transcriptional regulator [Clostridium pasteurianum DSM 525 = ATCC 6013]|uniref:Transcriptional regulator n=1 Tax=Clostridium pasteurianum DSM 525 = ATCC 6013 TaxID=1262449 RepID=A0A0H3J2G1_CLOPA|nr:LysR family transcriptional regulator [Clostridium pasteurianum]AJA46982.1 transcriptional regulator [Clostridium pasteurianum DSM 525 = ATCC 6013]AJA50970.1 transcriptional regulator [Clostridium pasteurianum DSM 525 = ATCC 6013]AOZ74360.1 LysR family transcriptional regulator [Clostridium pasteurianum DSM 525 = ATCC 6013]AOZ78158.1 LysR family transcriptional regulator [Clostridium pasteurianum]ELP58233.1 transcriptional regulator [Clostridium pasteurianum DSM 525 = ATCC 6013]